MARVNVTQAAEMAGVSRAAMRRAIASGRVHRAADGLVDTEDLARAGYTLQPDATAQEITAAGTQQMALLSEEHDLIPPQRGGGRVAPGLAPIGTHVAREQEGIHASFRVHIEISGHQVEITLQDTDETRGLARMEALLKRLPHAATFADDMPHGPRLSPMRQRIMRLLQGYPAGLTRKEIQEKLDVSSNLKDTLYGMVRQKRLGTNGKGIYVLMSGKSPTKAS
jgi:hypothetical protein